MSFERSKLHTSSVAVDQEVEQDGWLYSVRTLGVGQILSPEFLPVNSLEYLC